MPIITSTNLPQVSFYNAFLALNEVKEKLNYFYTCFDLHARPEIVPLLNSLSETINVWETELYLINGEKYNNKAEMNAFDLLNAVTGIYCLISDANSKQLRYQQISDIVAHGGSISFTNKGFIFHHLIEAYDELLSHIEYFNTELEYLAFNFNNLNKPK